MQSHYFALDFLSKKRLLTNNENYEEKFVVFVYARLFCDFVYGM